MMPKGIGLLELGVAAAVVLAFMFGWLCALGAVGMWLYDANAPDAWVRPTFWQWVGLAFLFEVLWIRLRPWARS